MIKFIALILSNLILLQSLNVHLESFSKLNVLLEHAQYHQEKYDDNFFDFIIEHYGDNELSTKSNHKEHKDLPFKHDSINHNHLPSDFTLITQIHVLKKGIINPIQQNYFHKELLSFFEKTSVFQPPKYA